MVRNNLRSSRERQAATTVAAGKTDILKHRIKISAASSRCTTSPHLYPRPQEQYCQQNQNRTDNLRRERVPDRLARISATGSENPDVIKQESSDLHTFACTALPDPHKKSVKSKDVHASRSVGNASDCGHSYRYAGSVITEEGETALGSATLLGSDDGQTRSMTDGQVWKQATEAVHIERLPPLFKPKIRTVVHKNVKLDHQKLITAGGNGPAHLSPIYKHLAQHYETLLPKLRRLKTISPEEINELLRGVFERGMYSVVERGLSPGMVGDVSKLLESARVAHVGPAKFDCSRNQTGAIKIKLEPIHSLAMTGTDYAQSVLATSPGFNRSGASRGQNVGEAPTLGETDSLLKADLDPNRVLVRRHSNLIPVTRLSTPTRAGLESLLKFVPGQRDKNVNAVSKLKQMQSKPWLLVPSNSIDLDAIEETHVAEMKSKLHGRKLVTDTGLPILPGWIITIKLWQVQRDSESYKRFDEVARSLGVQIIAQYIIERILRFLSEYAISYADLNCRHILETAQRPIVWPLRIDDVYYCIENIEKVLELALKPGQRFHTKEARTLAAVAIQNAYARHIRRREHLEEMARVRASWMIRKYWERSKCLKKLRKQVEHKYEISYKSGFRRLWSVIKRDRIQIFGYKRLIIQLCSWSLSSNEVKNNMLDVDIGRALAMYDDNVDMVFVLPHLSKERMEYFISVFETSAFPKSPIVSGRLRFIVPEVSRFLPKTSSVAASLFFSNKALNQIKAMCAERTALICCDTMNEYVVRCCTVLNVPFFGPSVESLEIIMKDPTRERKFLRDCCVPSIKEYDSTGRSLMEFLACICKAVTLCKNVPVWSLWPRKPIMPRTHEASCLELPSVIIHTIDTGIHTKHKLVARGDEYVANLADSRAGSVVGSRSGSMSKLFDLTSTKNTKPGNAAMGKPDTRAHAGALSQALTRGIGRQPETTARTGTYATQGGNTTTAASCVPAKDATRDANAQRTGLVPPSVANKQQPERREYIDPSVAAMATKFKESILSSMRISRQLNDMDVDTFIDNWKVHGGVVRAFPNAEGNFRIVEVGISVEWSLQWRLIVSCETRFHRGKTYGIIVPQQSCDAETLIRHLYKIAKVCAAREIFGSITVEFWAWKDPQTGKTVFVATRLKPFFTPQLQRASAILLATGCKTDKFGYGMSYLRTDLPIKMTRLAKSMFGDRKKALLKFQNVIPKTPHRVALHFDNLRHSVVGILTRRGALAKLTKRGMRFDLWKCFGCIFSKEDSFGSDFLPMTCIASTLNEVYELFLGCLLLIERHLEAKSQNYSNNFRSKARHILTDLIELRKSDQGDTAFMNTKVYTGGGASEKAAASGSNESLGSSSAGGSMGTLLTNAFAAIGYGDEYGYDPHYAPKRDSIDNIEISAEEDTDLEELMYDHVQLPFGEMYDRDILPKISIENAEDGDAIDDSTKLRPSQISSTTTLLLIEEIASMVAAESDPEFFKAVPAPTQSQKHGRRKSLMIVDQSQGITPSMNVEQQEAVHRAEQLCERLEALMDVGEGKAGAASYNLKGSATISMNGSRPGTGASHTGPRLSVSGTQASEDAFPIGIGKISWHRLARDGQVTALTLDTNVQSRRPSAFVALSPTSAVFNFGDHAPSRASTTRSRAPTTSRNNAASTKHPKAGGRRPSHINQ